jgi:hypothetical protein
MKPLSSGTPEIGLGIFACVVGALVGAPHFVFGAGDEPGWQRWKRKREKGFG